MSAARVGRILARWWPFITAVTLAAMLGSILWQAFGPVAFRSEAELLLALNLPPDSENRQFGIENSRAQASAVVIEDLVRLAHGREILREVFTQIGSAGHYPDFQQVFETMDVYPLARGLRIELAWPDPIIGQAVVDTLVELLLKYQTTYYPALAEVGTLQLIDKTAEPTRPPTAVVALDVMVKTIVALFIAIIAVLVVDWRANRLYASDVAETLDMRVIGTVQ